MPIESTIRAYQKVLNSYSFKRAESFSEDFAQKRFSKKFQEPAANSNLSAQAWADWIEFDQSLPEIGDILLPGEWYVARASLHEALRGYNLSEFSFPKGSEFHPTRGHNSLEARLSSSRWTCTYENFEAFSKLCYSHRGLKTATRRRYNSWYKRQNFDISIEEADRFLYRRFSPLGGDFARRIFDWKLERIVTLERGSRFSTVPKNNDNERPINVECFANILTQSQVGHEIRRCLMTYFGTDLDTLQLEHRKRISDLQDATIDLKNASDSVLLSLCRFLLPNKVFKDICERRSNWVLGPDNIYYPTKKVSSMGNGFTFELMTLILTALTRVLDVNASVYGDDIIISATAAPRLISLLESVGFVINKDKSFIDGPFRESCGANFHREEGYIESYDFEWPTSIGDCVMIFNKCYRLRHYPSFKKLYHNLYRVTPHALHGGPSKSFSNLDLLDLIGKPEWDAESTVVFPPFFVTSKWNNSLERVRLGRAREVLLSYCYEPSKFRVIRYWEWEARDRSPSLRSLRSHRHWAKYLMYLDSNRVASDVITGAGKWVEKKIISSGTEHFRLSSVKGINLSS